MADVITADSVPHSAPFLTGYCPTDSAYDELYGRDGAPRAHWAYLIRSLEALGANEFDQRWREARRLLRENGVTYNVYDDAQAGGRLWPLDPIPILLTSAEWQAIEHALMQRAQLLEPLPPPLYWPHPPLPPRPIPPHMIYA